MSEEFAKKIKTDELQIVDSEGRARSRLASMAAPKVHTSGASPPYAWRDTDDICENARKVALIRKAA